MAQDDAGIPSPVAVKVAGITQRMLDYWATTGLVVPSLRAEVGRGKHRRYDLRDVVALATVAGLRREGVSLQNCRRVQRLLLDYGIPSIASARLVVFEGKRPDVLLARSEHHLVSILENRGQVVATIVPLKPIERDVKSKLREALRERAAQKKRRARKAKSARKVSTHTPHEVRGKDSTRVAAL